MKLLDFPETLPEKIEYLLQPLLTLQAARVPLSDAQRAAWQEWIADHLSVWARDPQQLGDDGIEAPSGAMIRFAGDVAAVLRDRNVEPPERIVPDGDGGVVFRWRSGNFTWSLELDADGSMETSLVENCRLVSRHSVHGEPVR